MNELDNTPLATELLHMVKQSAKRWFIAFLVTLGLWFVTIIGFILYEYYTLPVDDTMSIEQQSDNDSRNLVIGGDYNGITTEDNTQTQER